MAKKNNSPTKVPSAKKAKSTSSKKGKQAAGGAKQLIMRAIASQRMLGGDDVDRKTVQSLAQMTSTGSFNTTLLNMKKLGLVDYNSNTVRLTQLGLDQLGEDAAIPTSNEGIQEKLKENIKQKKSREIFDILTDGRAYSREELAAKMGLENNNSFGTYISALNKVTERVDGKKIRLMQLAFPLGRPCDTGTGI